MKWLFWPVSVAVMTRAGRYVPYGVAGLAHIGGRYEPCWPLFAARRLFWPVLRAVASRAGRYLLCEVAVLARVAGRYEPYWPLVAV